MTGNNSSNHEIASSPPPLVFALIIPIGIMSVVFNGVLLFVMIANSRQVFASLGSYFIANLAVADCITGLNAIAMGCNGIEKTFDEDTKKALLCLFWVTVQVSFFTIFVMSTERLVAIMLPFRAALLMSKKKTVFYCTMVWLVAIVCAAMMYVDMTVLQFALTVVFEVVIVAIVIEYVLVFRQLRALWQHSKKRAVYTNDSSGIGSPWKCQNDLQREYQVTVVVATLAVILLLTVFPYMLGTQAHLGCIMFNPSCVMDESLRLFVWYYFPIELLNFLLNPVVYAWRLPKYRRAFLTTFGLNKGKNGNSCSHGSPKTTRSVCPPEKQIALLDC